MIKINRQKIELKEEQNIITGMCISTTFCNNIKRIISDYRLFQTSYNRKLIKWILEYYDIHNEAPKNKIREIFYAHKDELKDDTELDFVNEVVGNIEDKIASAEKGFNHKFYLDSAEKYLTQQNLLKLSAEVKNLAEKGQILQAEERIGGYKKIKKDLGSGLDIFTDPTIIDRIFEMEENSLFTIPGTFGDAFKNLYRGDLVGLAGISKLGKSFLLLQMGIYAILEGLKVAFFSLEMGDEQNAQRLFSNITGKALHPIKNAIVPYIEDNEIVCDYVNRDPFSQIELENVRNTLNTAINTGGLRIYDTSTGGTTISEIDGTLTNLSDIEDWDVDVAIIDYADILDSEKQEDHWLAESNKWKDMKRKIAQKHNCLTISASQLNGDALRANKTGIIHTAGSKAKFNHVSLWASFSITPEEARAGLCRCTVQGRHGQFDTIDEFLITRCLAMSRPIIDSAYMSKIKNYEEYIDEILKGDIDIEGQK